MLPQGIIYLDRIGPARVFLTIFKEPTFHISSDCWQYFQVYLYGSMKPGPSFAGYLAEVHGNKQSMQV